MTGSVEAYAQTAANIAVLRGLIPVSAVSNSGERRPLWRPTSQLAESRPIVNSESYFSGKPAFRRTSRNSVSVGSTIGKLSSRSIASSPPDFK
jgi:hypothetical protein